MLHPPILYEPLVGIAAVGPSPCFRGESWHYSNPARDPRKHGIYEGPAVKPGGCGFCRAGCAQHPRRRRRRSICPLPIEANDNSAAAPRSTSSEPEVEGDYGPSPSFMILRAGPTWRYAQASIRVQSINGQSHLTKFERRHHSPRRRFHDKSRPSCHASGSSFRVVTSTSTGSTDHTHACAGSSQTKRTQLSI